MAEPAPMSALDIITLLAFFVALFVIAWRTTKTQEAHMQASASKSTAYFLAERAVPFWAVSASLFASNIGAEHFVGLAGTAARSGIAVGWFEWGAIPCVLALGYFFLPVYLRMAVTTMPDYIERRYGKPHRRLVVGISLGLYVFTKISATLYAGTIILNEVSHLNKWVTAGALIVATTLYTSAGGLSAVVYTEVLQTGVLLVGGFVLMGYAFAEVGGMEGLRASLPPSFFHIFRPVTDPEYPWTGYVFGYYSMSIWYWCCDQVIVQRALAARDARHGRAGCIGAGTLKVLPVFLMVMPGMIARALMQREGVVTVATEDNPAGSEGDVTKFDRAYPWLLFRVMPSHTHGILLAAILSSLMSSLASVFNSSATLFTMDIYKPLRPASSERHLVWVGRVAVVCVAVMSLLWLPIIPLFGTNLFLYIQGPPSYVAPAISSLFVWGMLSDRPSPSGALWSLSCGLVLALLRFLLEVADALGGKAGYSNAVVNAFVRLNFLHFAALAFLLNTAILFGASYCTRPPAGGVHGSGGGGGGDGRAATGRNDSRREEGRDFALWHKGLYKEVLHAAWRRRAASAADLGHERGSEGGAAPLSGGGDGGGDGASEALAGLRGGDALGSSRDDVGSPSLGMAEIELTPLPLDGEGGADYSAIGGAGAGSPAPRPAGAEDAHALPSGGAVGGAVLASAAVVAAEVGDGAGVGEDWGAPVPSGAVKGLSEPVVEALLNTSGAVAVGVWLMLALIFG